MTRSRTLKLIGVSFAMVGGLTLPSVVAAETERPVRDIPADVRPADARPVDPTPDLEVLSIKCAQLEPGVAGVACAWRPATHPQAAGYQLWRIVDRGHRELVWRGGLDTTSNTARVPADATVARYAVLAVNEDGRIVGRSRVQTVRLRLPEPPVVVRPIDIAPVDVEPVAVTRKAPTNILRF